VISRAHFLNAVAIGGCGADGADAPAARGSHVGAMRRHARAAAQPENPWAGFSGVGDYARANGNTWTSSPRVMAPRRSLRAADRGRRGTNETYDPSFVGGGFSAWPPPTSTSRRADRPDGSDPRQQQPDGRRSQAERNSVRSRPAFDRPAGDPMTPTRPAMAGAARCGVTRPATRFRIRQAALRSHTDALRRDNFIHQVWADNSRTMASSSMSHTALGPTVGPQSRRHSVSPDLRTRTPGWQNEPVEQWKGGRRGG